MPRLTLLRQGQSTWNLENRFTGWVDVDLTAEGEAQARHGGALIADAQLNVGSALYYDSVLEALNDRGLPLDLPKEVYTGLFKALIFGVILSVISCAAGLKATSGAMGVGNATRKAVRDSIIAIIISNYFLSWFFFNT